MICEIRFQDENYAAEYTGSALTTAINFVKALESDNECIYSLPTSVSLRGHSSEFEFEWETVVISALDPKENVMRYEFDITFEPPENYDGPTVEDDHFYDAFYDQGCDDALISSTNDGRLLRASFTREGTTTAKAVLSALTDLDKGMPGFKLVSISVDHAQTTTAR